MSIEINVINEIVEINTSGGIGVPSGGLTNQVLAKNSNVDYDFKWTNNSAVVAWGQVTGTLSNQTDLQSALDLKVPTSRTLTINGVAFDLSANRAWTISSATVTSVGLSMPSAFSVANSPITSSGTLAVTANGTAAQYIRGDGQLATLPSNGSGGSSIAYYLNGSVNQGTIGGSVYYEMNGTPVIGAGTDFAKAGNGLISQFLTDVADPNRLEIPAGNWNFEIYMSASSSGGTPAFYVELLKYDGTTFTSIASSSANPEAITNGTTIDLYVTALAVPLTTLLATDRLALRVYIVNSAGGRTITMHTENSHLCEIITNFAGGVSALNGLTANTQYFATGTSGTDFAISSLTDTHTFNLPTASATNRGALSSADWTTFNGKASGNIYNANGTLTSARTLTLGGFTLDFIGSVHTNRFTSAGRLLLGTTSEGTFILDVNGNARITGQTTITGSTTAASGIARGSLISSTLVASANNDVLVGIDIAPTFTQGAFTGVSNVGLRISTGNLVTTTGHIILNGGAGFNIGLNGTANAPNINGTSDRIRFQSGAFTELIIDTLNNRSYFTGFNTRVTSGLRKNIFDVSVTDFASNNNLNDYTTAFTGFLGTNIFNQIALNPTGSPTTGTPNYRGIYINPLQTGFGFIRAIESVVGGAYFNTTSVSTSAILQADSTTQGFLPPRMTTTQKNAIGTPAQGLMVFDTTLVKLCVYSGTAWETITSI